MARAAPIFGDAPAPASAAPDLPKLHAEIGKLTLENDSLENALTNVCLPSAGR